VLFIFFSLAGVFPPGLAFGVESGGALENFLQKVEESSAAIDSFSCDFTQIKQLAIFAGPVEFSGQLSLRRPDKLRWEFVDPLPSVIVLNGNRGLKCTDRGPVTKFNLDGDPVMRMVASQLWAWSSGSYRELRDDFDFKLLPGPALVFSPRSKETASYIGRIKVVFDPDHLQPLEVEINEPGGDRTLLYFSNYRRNLALKDVLFSECRLR
ncbi:MAG: outer membrane lipoprotein carrier protein LolA, partial [Desulfurivibrionaceae bacterium]|nr:outer membrane lipoprotein carrier protein LolA [Desulfurivibrionaceae bacterium]